MSNILNKKVLSKIHKYRAPNCQAPTQRKMDRLPDQAFHHVPKDQSLNFLDVQSTKASPDWYTAGPGNWCLPTADVFLLRHVYQKQQWDLLKHVWQGGMFSCTRQLVWGKKGAAAYRWFGLHHFKDSCVLAWPVTLRSCRTVLLVEPDLSIQFPVLVPVSSLADTEVWRFEYFSYQGAWERFPQCRSFFKPGLCFC